jgi:hypothetical protein
VPEEPELGGRLRRLFELALDLPEDWFEEPFRDHSSSMRVDQLPGPVSGARASCAPARAPTTAV